MKLNRTGRPGPLKAMLLIAAFGLSTLGLSACAEEDPAEFTEGTKSGFMAACSDLVDDSRFVGEICDCVFEQTQEAFEFTEFATIDQQLVESPDSALSDEVVSIVADCVIDVTDL